MATDARKHTVPADTDDPDVVGDMGALSASIRDIIQVDNTTARQAVIDALTAAGIGPTATNPVYFDRTDAAGGRQLERTIDGTTFETFYTSAAGARAEADGEVTATTIAAGGTASFPVTFPAGRFSVAPRVTVSSDSSRLSYAAVSITTTGCTVQASNWTSAAASPTKLVWFAREAA